MSADVDICNLALAHLGDAAIVQNISPPDGSAQSSHCARFYPAARDALLELHAWAFCTRRVALASVANPTITSQNPNGVWEYAYAEPADLVNYLAVLDPAAGDDYSVGIPAPNTYGLGGGAVGKYTPQPYETETDINGNIVILTNTQNAILRYTVAITDTTKFSSLFTLALSHLLASMLAGPLLKGDTGRAAAKDQTILFNNVMAQARSSDANQRNIKPVQGAPWVANRG